MSLKGRRLRHSDQISHLTSSAGAQRAAAGRLVPALPRPQLQPDLPQVPQSPADVPPREPGLAQRPQMAAHLVRITFTTITTITTFPAKTVYVVNSANIWHGFVHHRQTSWPSCLFSTHILGVFVQFGSMSFSDYLPNNTARYLKDYDFYQRMLMERERSLDECSRKNRKRRARFVVTLW